MGSVRKLICDDRDLQLKEINAIDAIAQPVRVCTVTTGAPTEHVLCAVSYICYRIRVTAPKLEVRRCAARPRVGRVEFWNTVLVDDEDFAATCA